MRQVEKTCHNVDLVIMRNVFDPNERRVFSGQECLKDFLNFVMTDNRGRNILFAHNGSGYDSRLIFERAIEVDPSSQIKEVGYGTKMMELTCGQAIFRDTMLHFSGSLARLAKDLGLECTKGAFPHLFNNELNSNYIGPLPDLCYYDMKFCVKNQKEYTAFKQWHNDESLLKPMWNFKQEYFDYCDNDVLILAQAMKLHHDAMTEKYEISPWFSITTASYANKLLKRLTCTPEALELPDPSDKLEYSSRIKDIAWNKGLGVLIDNEYWFARKALRGGRTDVRHVYYNLTDEEIAKGYKIRYQDVKSLYPSVQIKYDYPVGLPTIFVWDKKFQPCYKHKCPSFGNDFEFCDCPFILRKLDSRLDVVDCGQEPTASDCMAENFFGFVCATLEPPRDLFHPVLVQIDQESRKCCGSLNRIVEGYFFTEEFKLALTMGYRLIKVHRLDMYRRGNVWRDFVQDLVVMKMSCERNVPSYEEQVRIAENHDCLGMKEKLIDSFENWQERPAQKQGAKITVNSVWGKHGQKASMPTSVLINSEDVESYTNVMDNISSDRLNVQKFSQLGSRLYVKTLKTFNNGGGFFHHQGYLPMAVAVPAYGRMVLYEQLAKLKERVLYHDTDSIIYVYKPEEYNIPVSDTLGEWEVEKCDKNHGGLRTFVGIGPKSYGVRGLNPCSPTCGCDIFTQNQQYSFIKVKGLSLKHSHRDMLNFDIFEQMVKHYIETGETEPKEIPQYTFQYSLGQGMFTRYYMKLLRFQPENMKGDLVGSIVYPKGFIH